MSRLDVRDGVLSRFVMHTLPITPAIYFSTKMSFCFGSIFSRFAKCVTTIFFVNEDFHD